MRTKFLVWLLMGFMAFPALSLAQTEKQYQKIGVLPDQAESEAHSASIVLGLNHGDPFGITGGCRADKGSVWIAPPWLNPGISII